MELVLSTCVWGIWGWILAAGFLVNPPVLRAAEPASPQAGLPTPAEIDSVMRELGDITGFRVVKRLPFQMVTKQEVNAFLSKQIRRSVRPSEIRAEEITLRKFGFVPSDFDLRKTTIDLLTEQAAAFYDFHRRKLFISDWANRSMRDEALSHELAHALADQNVSIGKFLAKGGDDSETSIARETVVEGQASWLMLELAARRDGRSLKDPETAAEFLRDQTDTPDSNYPVFSGAPLYIRATLMFPYEQGEKFQQAVFLKQGSGAFRQVFEHPPTSTAQILHPERYFANVESTTPTLPKPERGAKTLIGGTLGELDHRVLLRQYVDSGTAAVLGPKLRGAAYRVDEVKKTGRMTLIYVSEWESPEAAAEYFRAYTRVVRGKWKSVEVSEEDAGKIQGKSEDGYFRVTVKGNSVLSLEGFAAKL